VGDRPQIDNADDEDDLFGEGKLNVEGKRLRKMMRERGGGDDYDSSDSVSSSNLRSG
jgi:transcription initiation factor TFIIF subunit alpha